MRHFQIGKHKITQGGRPFVIAELSGNHNQSLERAYQLIDHAAASGAHAVKLQTYTPDSITIDCDMPDFMIKDPGSLWNNRKLYDLYREASTPYEWHEGLFRRCRERGLLCFSTPFDSHAVDFLEKFDPPCYKIASFENNYHQLISKVASTGKPIIISLGLMNWPDLNELLEFLRSERIEKIVLLKCTSTYPANPEDTNLRMIPELIQQTGYQIGLSDHTLGIGVAICGVGLGVQVIEKHFTDSRSLGGVDSAFSMEPQEMRLLVDESTRAWQAIGKATFDLSSGEKKSAQFKRSIYVVQNIAPGEVFTQTNVRIIRPGYGLAPRFIERVLGKRAKRFIQRGEPLTLEMLE